MLIVPMLILKDLHNFAVIVSRHFQNNVCNFVKSLFDLGSKSCLMSGVSYLANSFDIDEIDKIQDAYQCQVKCQEKGRCRFWTYNHNGKRCIRKTKIGKWVRSVEGDYATASSGPKTCDMTL